MTTSVICQDNYHLQYYCSSFSVYPNKQHGLFRSLNLFIHLLMVYLGCSNYTALVEWLWNFRFLQRRQTEANHKTLSHIIQSLGQQLNPGSPKYKASTAQSVQYLTIYWMTGVWSWQRQKICALASACRLALGPTQLPDEWVRAAEYDTDHSLPSSA
jgi:hypothetical protein